MLGEFGKEGLELKPRGPQSVPTSRSDWIGLSSDVWARPGMAIQGWKHGRNLFFPLGLKRNMVFNAPSLYLEP